MIKIKVGTSFSGVIATGSYENLKPSYSAEVELEITETNPEKLNEFISNFQNKLQEVCYGNFKREEDKQIVERIQKERKDIRFTFCQKCNKQHAHVSSIVSWDADFFCPPQELQQYCSHGNLYDAQAKHFIEKGEWLDVEKIDGTWSDLVIVKQGSLGLQYNDWNFQAFLKKHPLEKMEVGKFISSCKYEICGTPDVRKCYYDGKKTLADFKRTPDKLKNFKQMAGYVMIEEDNGEEPYEQMMIIPCNGSKTDQGWSKPIITTEIGQYKDMFLKEKENFKRRFGC